MGHTARKEERAYEAALVEGHFEALGREAEVTRLRLHHSLQTDSADAGPLNMEARLTSERDAAVDLQAAIDCAELQGELIAAGAMSTWQTEAALREQFEFV